MTKLLRHWVCLCYKPKILESTQFAQGTSYYDDDDNLVADSFSGYQIKWKLVPRLFSPVLYLTIAVYLLVSAVRSDMEISKTWKNISNIFEYGELTEYISVIEENSFNGESSLLYIIKNDRRFNF